jgi:hypothetical protein
VGIQEGEKMNWISELINNNWFISISSSIIAYFLVRWLGIIFFIYLPNGMKSLARLYFSVNKRDAEFIKSLIQFFKKDGNQYAIAIFFVAHFGMFVFIVSMFVLCNLMMILGNQFELAGTFDRWTLDIIQILTLIGLIAYVRMFAMFYHFFIIEFKKERE